LHFVPLRVSKSGRKDIDPKWPKDFLKANRKCKEPQEKAELASLGEKVFKDIRLIVVDGGK